MENDKTARRRRIALAHPPDLSPEDLLQFVELPSFAKGWKALGLTDDDRDALHVCIMAAPSGPPVIPGSGGLRKARFAPARWNTGKSGAARVCYAYFADLSIVLLVTIYAKNRKEDISAAETRKIRTLLKEIRAGFRKGPVR